MTITTAPIVNPNPDPALLDALCGADLECRHCRGSGKVQVAKEREGRDCPMCRGRGVRPTTTTMRPDPRPF